MDYTQIANTFIATLPLLLGAIGGLIVILRRQDTTDGKLEIVKKSVDGLLHTAIADAGEKGRQEGAAIATAGAAASAPKQT